MLYLLLKAAHVLGVVLFLGNVITGIFWKAHGDRRGDLLGGRARAQARAQALDGIIAADRLFTVPGVLLIIATGVALVFVGRLSFLTPWIFWSLLLFGAAGATFAARVGPLQKKLLVNARAGITGEWNESEYHALSRGWRFWGWVATVTPVLALVLMVLKPTG